MNTGYINVDCIDCGCRIPAREDIVAEGSVACDDCIFGRFGDMLTLDELGRYDLRDPDHLLAAVEWAAEKEGHRFHSGDSDKDE